ncbi:MAG: hypothetical protein JXB15_05775 [Anaerolineales bacterium]|nr:hypothetical protein [Anaerolineales bacterium]
MVIQIYRDVPGKDGQLIGRIAEDGKVYNLEEEPESYVGYVDYEEGEVYDEDDGLMGWIEDDGAIVGSYEDDDEEIGYVTEEGEVFGYDENGDDLYLGRVTEMRDSTEGAAAMLLFFDIEEDIEE